MQTLQQLQSGELKGITSLKLSCGLTEVLPEIIDLADTLELLDLSGNKLSHLPADFDRFKKLKIAFFSDNQFTEFPSVLAKCPNLEMIGFKSNQISYIAEDALPVHTRWLILTNNCLTHLPKSIGKCVRLQKVGLAGNQLSKLPIEMASCVNLELLRVSANNLTELPSWLLTLPRLSWLAYAGNPCSITKTNTHHLQTISWHDIELKEQLGEGASGIISKAQLNTQRQKQVAVKVFKGEVTSDGLPSCEMDACIAADVHQNLVRVIGKIQHHPQQKEGLVLELISADYKNLGNPPSFITCTRDTFNENVVFSTNALINITRGVASASLHLHEKGIMHGDLYAHNTMVDKLGNALLGDFGAATFYDIYSDVAAALERLDVRAFGCLLEDVLERTISDSKNESILHAFNQLKIACLNNQVLQRPGFKSVLEQMSIITIQCQ